MKNTYPLTPVETLAALRNGQPTPSLMLSLSPKADRAITHLLKELEKKTKVIKVLIGDPGEGKSTFETALFSRMDEVPHAVPIKVNLSASLRFRSADFMVSLILSPVLLIRAAMALKDITEKDSEKSQEIIEWMKTKRAWHLFKFISGWVQITQPTDTGELSIGDIYEFHKSMQSWFLEPGGTKTELSRCYDRAGGYVGRVPDAPKGFTNIFILLEEFIQLYHHLDLYPVWAIDEFESIALLQRNDKNLLLSAVREMIDAICAPEGTGCLMISTTNDGLSIIENYPALSDRLFSSGKFTLPNIYWEVNNFSMWDTEKALNALIGLYELGAKEGDSTCQAVIEVLPLHLKTVWFSDYIRSILASETPARSRLKHIVSEVLDTLSEGSFEDQCQYFARENSSTSTFEKILRASADSSFQVDAQADQTPIVKNWTESIFSLPKNNDLPPAKKKLRSYFIPSEFIQYPTRKNRTEAKPAVDPLFQVDTQADQEQIVKNWTESVSPLFEELTTSDDLWLAPEKEKISETRPSSDLFANLYTETIKYIFYKTTDKPRDVLIGLLKDSVKKRSSLSTIGNRIARLRDTGRLDTLTEGIVEDIITQANELTTSLLGLDSATEELICIFTLSASKTRDGQSKRNYLGLINARRRVGVDFIDNYVTDSIGNDEVTAIDEVISTGEVAKDIRLPEDFKEALFNPCYSLGAMRSFAYQFFLQRGHLPPDAMIDALVLRIARTHFDYRVAPSRNGIKFIREKSGGIIDLFRQSEVFLSDAELQVSSSLVHEGYLLSAE